MAKKVCNLNLDVETIDALTDMAEKLGMSRSQLANQVLGATLGEGSTTGVLKTIYKAALTTNAKSKKKTNERVPQLDF